MSTQDAARQAAIEAITQQVRITTEEAGWVLDALTASRVTCPTCKGTKVDIVATHPLGVKVGSGHPCRECKGVGTVPADPLLVWADERPGWEKFQQR